MARAHGARAQMALAFETVYGTAPTTGFRTVPFASTTLGSEQPLIASELLGQGRDPLAPIKDAVTADGDVVVPIDVENFGLWLKAAFGGPTTTGTTPKTHTFQSGNWSLPSMAIETGMPEVPRYAMYTGCVFEGGDHSDHAALFNSKPAGMTFNHDRRIQWHEPMGRGRKWRWRSRQSMALRPAQGSARCPLPAPR